MTIPGPKIALVTGANRGIGFEVCRQLAERDFHVILTSRDVASGEQAASRLQKQGKAVSFHRHDVADPYSVDKLTKYVMQNFGRVDVLINNAAEYLDEGVSVFQVDIDVAHLTIETNLFGPLYLCQVFVPLMIRHGYGRVVNVSSEAGSLSDMGSSTPSYQISKTALNALTRIVAAEVQGYDIKVNSVCPGWVRTEMGGSAAPRSIEQGAAGILWLATLPSDGPNGGFFRAGKALAW